MIKLKLFKINDKETRRLLRMKSLRVSLAWAQRLQRTNADFRVKGINWKMVVATSF